MESMRRSALVVAAPLALLATGIGISLAGVQIQNHAMNRCTSTPPGFPKRLSRAGINVDWKAAPFRYLCVYDLPNGSVEKHPAP